MDEEPTDDPARDHLRDQPSFRPAGLAEHVDRALLALDAWRERPSVVAGGALAAVVIVVTGWWFGRASPDRPVEDLIPQIRLETTLPPTTSATAVVVHVAGAVNNPGVYTLNTGARVEDALEAAGGVLAGADLDQLNLAAPVPDGVQIRVPVVGEVLSTVPLLGTSDDTGPVDINQADVNRLDELPGIGPATAAAIIAWRDEHGPFSSVDGLLDVPGIGPSKLAALADLAIAG